MHHAADLPALHERTRERGVNPLVLWLIRAILQPFFHIYFRMVRIGREHIPAEGPVILASNHRSFIDPFVIGTMVRRPVYYVAKRELFEFHPVLTWLLSALGAFPVDRGAGDEQMIDTAKGDPRARGHRADVPRGHAGRAPARWASPSAASAGSRSRPARRSFRSR